jgi:hypothetical protein
MKKLGKPGVFLSDCLLLPAILAQWCQPVASVVALDPLYWAMRAVLYRRTTTAIKMASKYGALFVVFFLHATPLSAGMIRSKYLPDGGVQWLIVITPDPLHQAMYAALQRRIITAIKTSHNGGVLFHIVDFDINHNSR